MNQTTVLTAIETKDELRQMAQQMNMPCNTFEDACRVDVQLRRQGRYAVPNASLHAWFPTPRVVNG